MIMITKPGELSLS